MIDCMPLKKKIKGILSSIAKIGVTLRIIPRIIIVKPDGGICSQIHFYLISTLLGRTNKCSVTYDMSWFETVAKDTNGEFCRNFDLLKIFPSLPYKYCGDNWLKKFYHKFFYYRHELIEEGHVKLLRFEDVKAPAYVYGYFEDVYSLYKDDLFDEIFKIDTSVLPSDNNAIHAQIEEDNRTGETCAVHFRRGDLAQDHLIYGKPMDSEYYIRSFDLISGKSGKDVSFFIFSDEPDYFRKEILLSLGNYKTTLVDINGSERGWCDLILMSRCRHQIASQGSMGKYAAMLRRSEHRTGTVILPDNKMTEEWKGVIPNIKII